MEFTLNSLIALLYFVLLFTQGNYGNVTHRKELRKRLNCKSFEWYIRNVYPNIVIPSNMKYAGVVSFFLFFLVLTIGR